ncbi:hypothetical protein L2091_05985 [Curtobacterium albidum]|uniref:hypothetical protein n=1 Tax=Curtobacterium TaxID=2034 RepID=UPI002025E0C0|nr:hypothetical protein [Curtobacterium albidum]MCL9664777.1 hypothetical protein [Curtobacterium albidum]
MVPTVIYLDHEAIEARRADLLQRANMPLDVMRSKGANYQLDPEEQAILRALDELDFLAGDD